MIRALTATLAGLLASAAPAAAPVPKTVVAAVADPGRPTADRERDALRKPAETVAFAGVRPGMTVAELAPGGGYFTRILAKAVGPKGKVLALVTAGQAARPNGLAAITAVAAAYPNIEIVQVPDYLSIALPKPVDLFWTTENYHDFHNGPTADIARLNKAVYANLKKGGIFYVQDHSAAPGAGLEATSTVHRMDEALAKQELIATGFKLDAEGDALRHPEDDRTKGLRDTGSFTTDRFMLRMRK